MLQKTIAMTASHLMFLLKSKIYNNMSLFHCWLSCFNTESLLVFFEIVYTNKFEKVIPDTNIIYNHKNCNCLKIYSKFDEYYKTKYPLHVFAKHVVLTNDTNEFYEEENLQKCLCKPLHSVKAFNFCYYFPKSIKLNRCNCSIINSSIELVNLSTFNAISQLTCEEFYCLQYICTFVTKSKLESLLPEYLRSGKFGLQNIQLNHVLFNENFRNFFNTNNHINLNTSAKCAFNIAQPEIVTEISDINNYMLQKNYTNGYHVIICKSSASRLHITTVRGTKLLSAILNIHAQALQDFSNILTFTAEVFYSCVLKKFILLDLFIWNSTNCMNKPYIMRSKFIEYFIAEVNNTNILNANNDGIINLDNYLSQTNYIYNGIIYKNKLQFNCDKKYKFEFCKVYINTGMYTFEKIVKLNTSVKVEMGAIDTPVCVAKYKTKVLLVQLCSDTIGVAVPCATNGIKIVQKFVNCKIFDIFFTCTSYLEYKNQKLKYGIFKVFFDNYKKPYQLLDIKKIIYKPDSSILDVV